MSLNEIMNFFCVAGSVYERSCGSSWIFHFYGAYGYITSYICLNYFVSRAEDFDLVSGQTQFKLDRLGAGANTSQTVVVRPRKFGYFNFTAAEVG